MQRLNKNVQNAHFVHFAHLQIILNYFTNEFPSVKCAKKCSLFSVKRVNARPKGGEKCNFCTFQLVSKPILPW